MSKTEQILMANRVSRLMDQLCRRVRVGEPYPNGLRMKLNKLSRRFDVLCRGLTEDELTWNVHCPEY